MIKFIRTIKRLYNISNEFKTLQSELNEFEGKLKDSVQNYYKEFEEKIQQMTFAYTRNLDDTKSEYLKRYLEEHIKCLHGADTKLSMRVFSMEKQLQSLILDNEHEDDEQE